MSGTTGDPTAGLAAYGPDPPTTREVAAELRVDRRRLERYVDRHDPAVPQVLGWALAGPDAAPLVARWLAAREGGDRR